VRVILDTNVFVSAAIADGTSRRLLNAIPIDSGTEVIVSPALLGELDEVLTRPKFRRWISLDDVRAFIDRIRSEATLLPDPPASEPTTRDPDDDYLVALALHAHADALVSGDLDLTSATDLPIPTLTPADLFARLIATEPSE